MGPAPPPPKRHKSGHRADAEPPSSTKTGSGPLLRLPSTPSAPEAIFSIIKGLTLRYVHALFATRGQETWPWRQALDPTKPKSQRGDYVLDKSTGLWHSQNHREAAMDLQNPIFTDDNAAREALEAVRWPNGPICPHCGTIGDDIAKVE